VPEQLPSDLSRLGDEIVAAAERDVRARRRRVALLARGTVAALAALIVMAGVPRALAPADRAGEPLVLAAILSSSVEADRRPACDHPRSATFTNPRPCGLGEDARTLALHRPEGDLRLIQRRQ
jgi:hypothetical protein